MAERSSGTCKFFLQGRCSYGHNCRFSHSARGSATIRGRGAGRGGNSTTSRTSRIAAGLPFGVCDTYWTTGRCSRAFECSFKHSVGPTVSAGGKPGVQKEDGDVEKPVDFFCDVGGTVHDASIAAKASPVQVHNDIKPFLEDDVYLASPKRVQAFVRVLSNVNSRNEYWSSDDAQSFVQVLVKTNGISCISNILSFRAVKTDSRSDTSGGCISFQTSYLPILEFLTSDIVLRSTIHKNINQLYEPVNRHCATICDTLIASVGALVAAKYWLDPKTPSHSVQGAVLFRTLTTLFLQLFVRHKESRSQKKALQLVSQLVAWFTTWSSDVSSVSPTFQDPITSQDPRTKRLIIRQLREELDRLVEIVNRELAQTAEKEQVSSPSDVARLHKRQARVAQLSVLYDPPGDLRAQGPRHDNDFASISKIEIAPTHDEILSPLPPFLPSSLPDAPHHLATNTMERHIDIQFRLLREELVAPIRTSVAVVLEDLKHGSTRRTRLQQLFESRGGVYKTSGVDSVFFHLYTGITFTFAAAEQRDITVGFRIDAPPSGAARDTDVRKRLEYWKNGRRLERGSLVALVVVQAGDPKLFLGVVTSTGIDLANSARKSTHKVELRISFFDPEIELMALRKHALQTHDSYAFLIDSSIVYEATRPFLARLQTLEPADIPFARYLTAAGSLADIEVPPPKYATAPRFRFKLGCLAKPGKESFIGDMDVLQEGAAAVARQQLREHSTLDPSQVEAVVHSLTREVSLIQGPPGTGKSYTGRELLRLLIKSGLGPILLISYTNHALDHQVEGAVLSGVTRRIARLGSQSKNETVNLFTMEKLEKDVDELYPNWGHALKRCYADMKELEGEIEKVMRFMQCSRPAWKVLQRYLEKHHGKQLQGFVQPPPWIKKLVEHLKSDEETHGEWHTKGDKRRGQEIRQYKGTVYGAWREGTDFDIFGNSEWKDEKLLRSLGAPATRPIPKTDRDIDTLQNVRDVWAMSPGERKKLARHWEDSVRATVFDECQSRYNSLRSRYKTACEDFNDIRDERRRRILSQMDLIACTTTGAAKLTSVLTSVAPKVVVVDEAGQVLEAHGLTSLVSSVQHLILIGDPEQLRPNVTNFSLSMDSARGRELFRFDRSLMERLADESLPMSQINVQRRMRPSISHFIRTILYPALEDHSLVQEYPAVRGMRSDVFFLDHRQPEASPDESVSKYNMYEVEMVKDLVRYFLRQGDYNAPGDIAVLCAYLGQLQKVRQALRGIRIGVSMDERDADQLARQDMDDTTADDVVVAQQIELGTVDIFQGREAKIVIVSLVRNTGDDACESANIGFLKSSNRINVALSRAKHGLYIMGNTSNLRKNQTWSKILDEMEDRGQIGTGFPVICPRHSEQAHEISQPGNLEDLAPAGGCRRPCLMEMPCGHICPSVCHDTRDNHRSIKCPKPCERIECPREHPCPKRCHELCGDCQSPYYDIKLPCGHVKDVVPCYLLDRLDEVPCLVPVVKSLPHCEHSPTLSCSTDATKHMCTAPCGGTVECCGERCKSPCHKCQQATSATLASPPTSAFVRTRHAVHPCERILDCGHVCGGDCARNHKCIAACAQPCLRVCKHDRCEKRCFEQCEPCDEACGWICAHQKCMLPCAEPCLRVPCDLSCTKTLECGHKCPSVCGEPCEDQRCPTCILGATMTSGDVVNLGQKLKDIDLSSSALSGRLVSLDCGHLFTVEYLDDVYGLSDFYGRNGRGAWVHPKEPRQTSGHTPPICPSCAVPVTTHRYSRIRNWVMQSKVGGTVFGGGDVVKALDNLRLDK